MEFLDIHLTKDSGLLLYAIQRMKTFVCFNISPIFHLNRGGAPCEL
jgi:hypothetical protein